MDDPPAEHRFEDLAEGQTVARRYTFSEPVVEAFLVASGDTSPIHVDEAYARQRGFPGRVMHGAILHAFVSQLVGMVLPGRRALLLSVELRYLAPSFLGDTVEVTARIAQKVESQRTLALRLGIENVTRGVSVASGRALVAVSDE